jgi:hypothetical protein
MNNRQLPLLPQQLKTRHPGMQSEETVEINHCAPGNIDGRPHFIVGRLSMRHDHIQTVRSASQKDDNQPLASTVRES